MEKHFGKMKMKNGLGCKKQENPHTTKADEITKNRDTKFLDSWCFEVNSV